MWHCCVNVWAMRVKPHEYKISKSFSAPPSVRHPLAKVLFVWMRHENFPGRKISSVSAGGKCIHLTETTWWGLQIHPSRPCVLETGVRWVRPSLSLLPAPVNLLTICLQVASSSAEIWISFRGAHKFISGRGKTLGFSFCPDWLPCNRDNMFPRISLLCTPDPELFHEEYRTYYIE